ncbi:CHAT domain-containing protein [Streptomyces sp. NPDC046931]|uniref:CHAT domain-containing protein n=1 Tax=Streptomyces sp. NPDC046931 TaxID=3154806 RepID=UPI0033E89453
MAGQLGWLVLPTVPDELAPLVDRSDALLTAWWRDHEIDALERLVATWSEILDHPHFHAAEADFRLLCQDRAAVCLCWHALETGQGEELDEAHARLTEILAAAPSWAADVEYHLGIIEEGRAQLRNSLAQALVAERRLRAVLAALPPEEARLRPRCMDVLARTLLWLHRHDRDRGSTDEAIALHRAAVTLMPRDSAYRGVIVVMLASSLRARFKETGRLSDLNEALTLLQETIRGIEFLSVAAYGHTTLGGLLRERYVRSGDFADLQRSLEAHADAVRFAPEGRRSWLVALNNQANALNAAYSVTRDRTLLEQAIDSLTLVVEATDPQDHSYPARLNNLGNSLTFGYDETGDPAYRDRAIVMYENAIAHSPADDQELSSRYLNLATKLARRHLERSRRRDRRPAHRYFRLAYETGMARAPEWALTAAFAWGEWAGACGRWSEAVKAYELGIETIELLFARQDSRVDKEAWLRTAQGVPARAAYACARAGRPEHGVLLQERGRTLLLAEALRMRGGDPPDLPSIRSAAGDRTLVYLDSADIGGTALIIAPGARKVRPVELPELRNAAVDPRVDLLARAYQGRHTDPELWSQTLDSTGRWAQEVIFDPLLPSLPKGTDHLVLIPAGRLTLLPLHSAWSPHPGGGRRYLVDELIVGYTPTAQALRPAGTARFREALVVDDPRPVSASPLPWSGAECAAALAAAGPGKVLAGPGATRAAVLDALDGPSLIHLSCHGAGRSDAPLMSGMLMAGDEPLTVGDIIALNTRVEAELVVMSACETFQVGTKLPDEVVSLPTALLQLGCRAVVATQWAVSSLAAALIVAAFYRRCAEGDPPARALRTAVNRLRPLTHAELAAHLKPGAGTDLFGLPPDAARPLWRTLRRRDPDARPLAQPAEWAAFGVVGG